MQSQGKKTENNGESLPSFLRCQQYGHHFLFKEQTKEMNNIWLIGESAAQKCK